MRFLDTRELIAKIDSWFDTIALEPDSHKWVAVELAKKDLKLLEEKICDI